MIDDKNHFLKGEIFKKMFYLLIRKYEIYIFFYF